jgi:hypothetical protein
MRRRRWRLVVVGTKRKKRRRTCIIHLWCNFHEHLAELFIIHRELLVFFGEISCVLLLGHDLLRLGARYWLRAPNSWDIMGRSQVLGHSVGEPVHPILSGLPDDLTSIHKFGSKSRWVEGSFPYLSLNRLL